MYTALLQKQIWKINASDWLYYKNKYLGSFYVGTMSNGIGILNYCF